jgi:hypothetical protein
MLFPSLKDASSSNPLLNAGKTYFSSFGGTLAKKKLADELALDNCLASAYSLASLMLFMPMIGNEAMQVIFN